MSRKHVVFYVALLVYFAVMVMGNNILDWISRYIDFSDPNNVLMSITGIMAMSGIVLLASVLVVSDQRSWVVINSLLFMVIGGCLLIAPVAGNLVGRPWRIRKRLIDRDDLT